MPEDVRFDRSDCCIEGHSTRWLDGEIENFSGIAVFDGEQNCIAGGWMEFIETESGLEVFWWFLQGGEIHHIQSKNSNNVPKHVWEVLSPKVQANWRQYAPK